MAIGDFVGKFGSYGSGDGQFKNYLMRLDVDSNYIYVADDDNSRFQIFNINSPYSFINKINLVGLNYRDPFGIKVDNNYIYWVNNVDTRFVKNNKNSPYTNVSNISIDEGLNYQPVDIAIDSNYMYIPFFGVPAEIRSINSPYVFVANFGTAGTGSGDGVLYLGISSNLRGGIAVDNNYIYVANTFNNRVEIFNKNSPYNFVAKFGTAGVNDGQLNLPQGIAVSDLYIYVSSSGIVGNTRINIFNKNSPYNFVTKFGSYGTGDGQFVDKITSIVRYMDLLYIAESNMNPRIQIFGDFPSFVPGAKGGGGGGAGGGASGRHIKRRYMGRSLGR